MSRSRTRIASSGAGTVALVAVVDTPGSAGLGAGFAGGAGGAPASSQPAERNNATAIVWCLSMVIVLTRGARIRA